MEEEPAKEEGSDKEEATEDEDTGTGEEEKRKRLQLTLMAQAVRGNRMIYLHMVKGGFRVRGLWGRGVRCWVVYGEVVIKPIRLLMDQAGHMNMLSMRLPSLLSLAEQCSHVMVLRTLGKH